MNSSPTINNSFQAVWQHLENHYKAIGKTSICDLFQNEPQRLKNFTVKFNDIYVDFSKTLCAQNTLDLLLSLADASEIKTAIKRLYSGEKINSSEKRPALHTALRSTKTNQFKVDGKEIFDQVETELQHMGQFIEKLHAGDLKGHTGKSIDTFINIGIGGSDLGPRMVVHALNSYRVSKQKIYFVANIDAKEINRILSKVDPETTLFCISSKSFSTKETLTNATSAKQWLISSGCKDIAKHFIAVSTNRHEAEKFGIDSENIFQIWDWVGGRYSLWSATGLPIAASIGMKNFRALLAGAKEMDDHFMSSPPEKNISIILAMLDIWYINFYSTNTLAIIPYDESLKLLPDYLCQLFMESNGKNITHEGQDVDYPTAPIVWGGVGTNVQHTFFQLLHQGTHLIPVEFLVPLNGESPDDEQHKILLANCFAQSKALMTGNIGNNHKPESYQKISGNKPSTTIIYNELSPKVLGSLLAMYEHRTFVQGHIWNINSFDQWGVELGKKFANSIADELNGNEINTTHDASTKELIARYINRKK